MKVRNTFIIFIVSGFWHGANWTFIVWGALNAIYFLPLLLLNRNRENIGVVAAGKYLPGIRDILNMATTFGLTVFAWVFFRAENVSHALSYLSGIFSSSIFTAPEVLGEKQFFNLSFLLLFFIIIEWMGRENDHAIEKLGVQWKRPLRWLFYYGVILLIVIFRGTQQEFIYFQF